MTEENDAFIAMIGQPVEKKKADKHDINGSLELVDHELAILESMGSTKPKVKKDAETKTIDDWVSSETSKPKKVLENKNFIDGAVKQAAKSKDKSESFRLNAEVVKANNELVASLFNSIVSSDMYEEVKRVSEEECLEIHKAAIEITFEVYEIIKDRIK